jgi:leucyl/phenylalanyl-tRNA--protein transferase
VFDLDSLHVPRSLERTLRRGRLEVTFDRDFPAVIRACATAPRGGQPTWITPAFVRAYEALHGGGQAHSVEVWQDGKLAGGLYGVAIGGFFSGESMFHQVTDASKVAVVQLARRLREKGFCLFDTQMVTAGARARSGPRRPPAG